MVRFHVPTAHARCRLHHNRSTIAGWQWLRTNGAQAVWELDTSSLEGADPGTVRLLFNGLITDRASGGAGYSSVLTFNLSTVPAGHTTEVRVPTVNPYGPPNPNLTTGEGYTVNGTSEPLSPSFVQAAMNSGRVRVELVWPGGVDNRYHVAVRKDSVSLTASPSTGGGTDRQEGSEGQ